MIFGETGASNPAVVGYYDRLINDTIKAGFEPVVVLHRSGLPEALEKNGGWNNPDIVGNFSTYAEVCFKTFGDRVTYFKIMHEHVYCTF